MHMTITQKMNFIVDIYKLMEDAKIKSIDINSEYNYGGDVFTFEDGQTIEIRSEGNSQKEEA